MIPTLTPSPTPTALVYEASCPSALEQILADFIPNDQIISWNNVVAGVDIEYLVHYTIVDNELKTPLFYPVADELENQQADRTAHDDIGKLYTRIIPAEGREILRSFLIFTDGPKNYLAAVDQSRKNPYKWDLNVDSADSIKKSSLIYTLLHEQGHLITLSSDQVPVNLPVYRNPHDNDIYQRAKEACPQYFTGEGCSTPAS